MTRDLDVVMLPEDRERVSERLISAGYEKEGNLSIGGSSWRAPDGTPVDVIEGAEEWWPVALREAAANRDAEGAFVLTAPYLVLMTLLAGRMQDVADVGRMLGGMTEPDLGRVRDVVREHAPPLNEDLESMIVLGKLEQQG